MIKWPELTVFQCGHWCMHNTQPTLC